jgi:type IV secretory pathway VirB10-like protein
MKKLGRLIPVIAAVTMLLTTPLARAQQTSTLGEIAKKEEERRKTVKPATKVYTNRDLPKTPAPQTPPDGALPPPVAPPAPKPDETAKPDEEKDEKDENWWRARMTNVRTELQRSEMALEAFQSRVNALSTDFAARDDPYQRAQIAIERQKTLNELERVKSDIVRLKQQMDDIEEEARLAGVPPGWLR